MVYIPQGFSNKLSSLFISVFPSSITLLLWRWQEVYISCPMSFRPYFPLLLRFHKDTAYSVRIGHLLPLTCYFSKSVNGTAIYLVELSRTLAVIIDTFFFLYLLSSVSHLVIYPSQFYLLSIYHWTSESLELFLCFIVIPILVWATFTFYMVFCNSICIGVLGV